MTAPHGGSGPAARDCASPPLDVDVGSQSFSRPLSKAQELVIAFCERAVSAGQAGQLLEMQAAGKVLRFGRAAQVCLARVSDGDEWGGAMDKMAAIMVLSARQGCASAREATCCAGAQSGSAGDTLQDFHECSASLTQSQSQALFTLGAGPASLNMYDNAGCLVPEGASQPESEQSAGQPKLQTRHAADAADDCSERVFDGASQPESEQSVGQPDLQTRHAAHAADDCSQRMLDDGVSLPLDEDCKQGPDTTNETESSLAAPPVAAHQHLVATRRQVHNDPTSRLCKYTYSKNSVRNRTSVITSPQRSSLAVAAYTTDVTETNSGSASCSPTAPNTMRSIAVVPDSCASATAPNTITSTRPRDADRVSELETSSPLQQINAHSTRWNCRHGRAADSHVTTTSPAPTKTPVADSGGWAAWREWEDSDSDGDNDDESDCVDSLLPSTATYSVAEPSGAWRKQLATPGTRCDLRDRWNPERWHQGKIVASNESAGMVQIHKINWSERYQEWVRVDSDRLEPPGAKWKQYDRAAGDRPGYEGPTIVDTSRELASNSVMPSHIKTSPLVKRSTAKSDNASKNKKERSTGNSSPKRRSSRSNPSSGAYSNGDGCSAGSANLFNAGSDDVLATTASLGQQERGQSSPVFECGSKKAWEQLVKQCALSAGRRKRNLNAYTSSTGVARQLASVGEDNARTLITICKPTISASDRQRVTLLCQQARQQLDAKDAGPKAAFSAISHVYGISKHASKSAQSRAVRLPMHRYTGDGGNSMTRRGSSETKAGVKAGEVTMLGCLAQSLQFPISKRRRVSSSPRTNPTELVELATSLAKQVSSGQISAQQCLSRIRQVRPNVRAESVLGRLRVCVKSTSIKFCELAEELLHAAGAKCVRPMSRQPLLGEAPPRVNAYVVDGTVKTSGRVPTVGLKWAVLSMLSRVKQSLQ